MARPLRIQLPGLTYHVHARGNNKMTIFADDVDRERFIGELAEILPTERVACFAYCLMSTHYHLLIRPQLANLSAALQKLNGSLARRWNFRHKHVGHVFGGRFDAHVIDTDTYFLEACRYVVNNPVEARLAAHPAEYQWSSYRATAGLVAPPPFLDIATIHTFFGTRDAAVAYERFVAAPASPSFVDLMSKGRSIVGDETFAAQFRPLVEKARGLTAADRRLGRPPLEAVLAGGPNQSSLGKRLVEAHDRYAYSVTEIAEYLGAGKKRAAALLKAGRRGEATPATRDRPLPTRFQA